MTGVGKKIAEIRKQKGLTQEEVSEQAKINLRTLQRIEKDETEPRGNTLNNICHVLGVNIEDILDYGKIEDRNYLIFLHLSVLSGIFVPLGNIILPLILWLNKRDRIVSVAAQGSNILNFQILYTIIFYVAIFGFAIMKIMHLNGINFEVLIVVTIFMYAINIIYPIVNAILVNKGHSGNLYPAPVKIIK